MNRPIEYARDDPARNSGVRYAQHLQALVGLTYVTVLTFSRDLTHSAANARQRSALDTLSTSQDLKYAFCAWLLAFNKQKT